MYFAASIFGKCQKWEIRSENTDRYSYTGYFVMKFSDVHNSEHLWVFLKLRCQDARQRLPAKGVHQPIGTGSPSNSSILRDFCGRTNIRKIWEPTLDSLFEPIVELKIIFPKFPKANSGSLWGDIFKPHPEFLELCEVPWGWFPSPIPGFWEPILPHGKTTSDDLMHQVASGNLKDILGSWTIRQRLHLHPDTAYEQFDFGNWTNFFWKVTWESSENHVICIISSGQTELVDSGDFGRISWKNCFLEWGWVIISSLPRPSQLCKHTSRKNPSCTKPFSVVPSHQIPLAFDTFFFKTIVGRHHEIANSISFRHK